MVDLVTVGLSVVGSVLASLLTIEYRVRRRRAVEVDREVEAWYLETGRLLKLLRKEARELRALGYPDSYREVETYDEVEARLDELWAHLEDRPPEANAFYWRLPTLPLHYGIDKDPAYLCYTAVKGYRDVARRTDRLAPDDIRDLGVAEREALPTVAVDDEATFFYT